MINPVSTKSSKQVVNPFLIYNADVYKKLGDKVVLSPGPVTDINSIVWKHGSSVVVQWSGGNVTFNKHFTGRCKLNPRTGELTISGLTLEDSGSYTAEINNRVMNPIKILVISEVPTPTVSESCDAEKTHCVLTCEGITTDAEPVVYSWWSGDVMKSETKELRITKEEELPFCWCTMINPVSTKSSKQVVNPFLIYNADIYKKLGDKVVLSPGPVTDINSIVWKHGSSVVVQWSGGNVTFNKHFTDRCKLNPRTGELTISGLTLEDSGSYTAEINDRVMNPIKILVISEVPTPTVSKSCDAEKTHCVLTCEGITTDAEPVNYTWRSGDVMKSETKELNITKEEKDPSFFCKLENPVSFESSKEVLNPFITTGNNKNSLNGLLMLPVVGVIVGVIVAVFIYKRSRGKYPPRLRRVRSRLKTKPGAAASSQTSPIILPENLPLQSLQSNGAAQPLVVVETVNEVLIDINNDPARLQQ